MMADLRLGGFGQGSTQTTLDRLNEHSFSGISQEGTKAQGYQELKAYVSQLGANATLRVKNSNSRSELALGKQGFFARLFKGDRSELTANTIARLVQENLSLPGADNFLNLLRNENGDGYDVSRDRLLAAFTQIESMKGLDNLVAPFERRAMPGLMGAAAAERFKAEYPSQIDATSAPSNPIAEGIRLNSKIYGDVMNRGTVRFDAESGRLFIDNKFTKATHDDGSFAVENARQAVRFFTDVLRLDPSDKKDQRVIQNAMNNVLSFFTQTNYIEAARVGGKEIGAVEVAAHRIDFAGSISARDGMISIERETNAQLVNWDTQNGILNKETGWRYRAVDSFGLPLDYVSLAPHKDFDAGSVEDASRVQFLEKGQRRVADDDGNPV
jgi:hypothetical protein